MGRKDAGGATAADISPESQNLLKARTESSDSEVKRLDAECWSLSPFVAAFIFSGLLVVGAYTLTKYHDIPAVATPAASILPGYVEGLDVATSADARAAAAVCGAAPVGDVGACEAVLGCEYWNGACGLSCARLATGPACHEASGCAWDEEKLHCGWAHPTCDAVHLATHCAATKFCEWNADAETCARARYACEDLTDRARCERSAQPECAWNALDDENDDGDDAGEATTEVGEVGSCADLRQCETIALPSECATHRGCAFSQAAGSCVSLNVVAADKAMCVASAECPIADTFCNMDFGSKGYCQNCLPLVERGVGVCADEAFVAAPAAEECARACFGE